jgi:hypothetical protein
MMDATKNQVPAPKQVPALDYKRVYDLILVREKLTSPPSPTSPKLPYILAHVERELVALDVSAKADVEAWRKADEEAAAKAAEAAAKAKAETDAAHAKISDDAAKAKAKVDEDAAAKAKANEPKI